MSTPLSRLIGSHASLIGMASYLVLSGPSAAFAASSASVDTNISVTVSSVIGINKGVDSSIPVLASGTVAKSSSPATFNVYTTDTTGYDLSISLPNGACTGPLCSVGGDAIPRAGAVFSGYPTGNAVAEGSVTNGVWFRMRSTGVLNDSANYGADETPANAKWGGMPATSTIFFSKATEDNGGTISAGTATFLIDFLVSLAPTQPSGVYTGTATLTATTHG